MVFEESPGRFTPNARIFLTLGPRYRLMTAPCIVGEGLNPSDEMDSYDNDYQMQHKTITIINKGRRTDP